MINERKCIAWLERQLAGRPDKPISKVMLRHLLVDESSGAVDEWVVDPQTSPRDLFNVISERAVEDVEGIGGSQKYVILPFFGDSPTPVGRFVFYLNGMASDQDGNDIAASEPANVKGLIAQQMRHNEVLVRTLVAAQGAQMRMVEIFAQRAETSENRRSEMIEVFEQAASLKNEREVVLAREKAKEERRSRLYEKAANTVMPFVGSALQNLLTAPTGAAAPTGPSPNGSGSGGQPMAPSAPQVIGPAPQPTPRVASGENGSIEQKVISALETGEVDGVKVVKTCTENQVAALKALVDSIDSETAKKLQEVLSPDAQIGLWTIYESIKQSEEPLEEPKDKLT